MITGKNVVTAYHLKQCILPMLEVHVVCDRLSIKTCGCTAQNKALLPVASDPPLATILVGAYIVCGCTQLRRAELCDVRCILLAG